MLALYNFLFAVLAFVFVGQVVAAPISMPMPMQRAVEERRQLAPLDTIPAYVKRLDVNTFPAQEPSQSDGNTIIAYGKQQKRQDINTLPEQVPSKSIDGNPTEYKKRQNAGLDINTFRADLPSAAPQGEIVSYESVQPKKRAPAVNSFPAQLASKSSGDGTIVAYDNNQARDEGNVAKRWEGTIPAELAVRSVNGVIELY